MEIIMEELDSAKGQLQQIRNNLRGIKGSQITIPDDFKKRDVIQKVPEKIDNIVNLISSSISSIDASVIAFMQAIYKNEAIIQAMLNGEFNKGINSILELYKKIESIYAKLHPGEGKGSLNSKGQSMYQGTTFLETMEKCWLKLYQNGENIQYYEQEKKAVPLDWAAEDWDFSKISYVDCSSFICWGLYEYGYDEFKRDKQYTTYDFMNEDNLERWQKDYNWEVKRVHNGTEAAAQVKAGDIVVYDEHMFIVKEVKNQNEIITYDAGDQSHWVNQETKKELQQNGVTLGNSVRKRRRNIKLLFFRRF